ncbi:MAG: glycosyltransferase [Planctomycetes bacterium]|nr:glycosyltransferase [Planctomycetota bacterium]MBI3846258.1 glycosyltransferase [Planctomycetota bacterium]
MSAVVCTHARPEMARLAVESLLDQDFPAADYEVLVVSDTEVAITRASSASRAARFVRETRPGLSRARNRALAEARAPVIAYLDDDAIADPGWLRALAATYAEEGNADAVGGRIEVEWPAAKPSWWRPELDDTFNQLDLAAQRTRLAYPRVPLGTNLSLRAETARRLGGFREDLGRVGSRLLAGEESELILRIEQAGGVVLFEPRALVRHFAPPARVTRAYVRRRAFWHGYSHARFERQLLPRRHSWNRYLTLATLPIRSVLEANVGMARQAQWCFVAGYAWQALTHPFGTSGSGKGPAT